MTRIVRKIVREIGFEGRCRITVKKFKGNFKSEEEALKHGGDPYEINEEIFPWELEDVFLNQGINAIWTLVCGGSETAFNSSNAHICVGDGTAAEDASQTGPQGTNYTYLPMDSGYPTYGSDQKSVFKATADGNTANHGWQEFLIANGNTTSAKYINRKVSDKGTKPSGETWVVQVELSLS